MLQKLKGVAKLEDSNDKTSENITEADSALRKEYEKIRVEIERYAQILVERLIDDELYISTAESCTGGMVAAYIVSVPDASRCFNESIVTYSDEAKMKYLGVSDITLSTVGAVSSETVREMAMGMRKQSECDISVVTSGIAGPRGGSEDKPVGLVYIAGSYKDKVVVTNQIYSGDRTMVRLKATLDAVRLCLNILDI